MLGAAAPVPSSVTLLPLLTVVGEKGRAGDESAGSDKIDEDADTDAGAASLCAPPSMLRLRAAATSLLVC